MSPWTETCVKKCALLVYVRAYVHVYVCLCEVAIRPPAY